MDQEDQTLTDFYKRGGFRPEVATKHQENILKLPSIKPVGTSFKSPEKKPRKKHKPTPSASSIL
jgi:hypothetical protein